MLPTRIFVILATVLSALMPIRASALNADQVQYVNAHGTSTPCLPLQIGGVLITG